MYGAGRVTHSVDSTRRQDFPWVRDQSRPLVEMESRASGDGPGGEGRHPGLSLVSNTEGATSLELPGPRDRGHPSLRGWRGCVFWTGIGW